MKFPKKVDIDVSKDLYNPIQVKQSDNARYLLFRILDNGVPFDLTGKTVRFFGKKPDGKEIYNDMTITSATKGECELRLTSGALSTPGILQLEIEIKENEVNPNEQGKYKVTYYVKDNDNKEADWYRSTLRLPEYYR